ncbi:DUF3560 domain-containing protein [Streptomyces sp. NPDC056773]|uniref:DUF3560 domain-containing protein n=1 Tax=unclassified Streptomyces TaxID=2593676 RepID=UPI003684D112
MTIAITHTRREGTLINGTSRGDGSAEILKLRMWGATRRQPARWSRNLGCWYFPHSRDKATYRPNLELLAQMLRDEGFTVTLEVDETDRRSFAEAEQDRTERAADRADRFTEYSDNAANRSNAAYSAAHQIADGIPFGQRVLIGHHSQARAERDRDRIHDGMAKSIHEGKKSEHWAGRAAASAGYETFRKNPGTTLRRIAKLQADLRAVEKWMRGQSAKGYSRNPGDPELPIRHAELTEEINYWQQVIKEAEAAGFKVWSKADFKKGDFALHRGTWFEVLRVNAKSVTIPHIHNGIGVTVVHADGNRLDWTWTAPYDDITGRKTAEEMTRPEPTPTDSTPAA